MVGTLSLDQAGQIIGGKEAKAAPFHLACDKQTGSKDAASQAKGM